MSGSATLLLRLTGPMQSWGTQSRFAVRDTGREPSKSGVVGLLCAALGRPREEPVDDLAALRLGVRVDREGTVQRDFHTAGGGTFAGKPYGVFSVPAGLGSVLGNRYYLADADFLVGLEGDAALLADLATAVAAPVWAIFLGRKSFVPSVPLSEQNGLLPGVRLEEALRVRPWPSRGTPRLRLVLETTPHDQDGAVRLDQPVGSAFSTRQFVERRVRTEFIDRADLPPVPEEDDHDVPLSASA